MKPLKSDLKRILKDFEQNSTDAYTHLDTKIDYDALDKAYDQALSEILKLVERENQKAFRAGQLDCQKNGRIDNHAAYADVTRLIEKAEQDAVAKDWARLGEEAFTNDRISKTH